MRGALAAGGIDISAHGITQAHLETMDTFAKQAQAAYIAYCAAAEEMGEAPDEFLCPVSCDLMVDPVLLPTSGQTMERASLERHLLSDECDPFNRKHLTMDMVTPDEDMIARIAAWRADPKAYEVEQQEKEEKRKQEKEKERQEEEQQKAAREAEQAQLQQTAASPPPPPAPTAPAASAFSASCDEPVVEDDEDAMPQAALAMSLQQDQQ